MEHRPLRIRPIRANLTGLILLACGTAATAQIDTLDVIEATQERMEAVDRIRSRPPASAWAKMPGAPALVRIDQEADTLPRMEHLYTVYKDAAGIAAISTLRRIEPSGTVDASTHYFDPQGRTLAVRWELSMHIPGCAADTAVASKEEYYAPDGGPLDRWTWLTDADGQDLDPATCRIPEPAGRMPTFRDRASLLKGLRINEP